MSGRDYHDRDSPPKRPYDDGYAVEDRRVRPRHDRDDRPATRSRSRSPNHRLRDKSGRHGNDHRRDHSQRDGENRRPRDPDESSSRHHRRHHHRRHHHHHSSSTAKHTSTAAATSIELPCGARFLSYKTDLDAFRPLLARYLDVQKQRYMEDMDEREIRGRWKSFVNKWNAGELAQGWYDPEVYASALEESKMQPQQQSRPVERGQQQQQQQARRRASPERNTYNNDDSGRRTGRERQRSYSDDDDEEEEGDDDHGNNEDEEDDYGPILPGAQRQSDQGSSARHGPGMPKLQDLALRRELDAEERARDREESIAQLRADRKADRVLQKARLEELVPRADPGSHERKLEKKRDLNDKLRAFRDKSPTGGGGEVDEGELMGGGDSIADYKRAKAAEQRRKTEREIRREEEARAREEERQEKIQRYKEKEDKTMEVLKEIARQRFG